MAATLKEIEIKDVGPVERIRIPLPAGGGIVVLTGDNGAGKSESLSAVRALLGSDEDRKALEPRDGRKSGSIEGFGRSIKVALTNRGDGQLGVSTLEDRLDIWKLVDPHIKDANSADSVRLKALLRVTNAEANIDLFDHLLGSSIEIDSKYIHEPDLVTMAGGVKRALEQQARNEEIAAQSSGEQAALCLKSVEGVDLDAPSDQQVLQQSYQAASQTQANLKARDNSAKEATRQHSEASGSLRDAEAKYSGATLAAADDLHTKAVNSHDEQIDRVFDLRQQLKDAEAELALRKERLTAASTTLKAAQQHESTIAAWRQQLETPLPEAPLPTDLTAADKAVADATQAIEQGGIVRQAKAKAVEAETWTKKRTDLLLQAEQWRKSAASVDSVLSDQIAELNSPIKVGDDEKGLRLVIDHKRGKGTYFSELSEGERWAVVIPIAIKTVGKNGCFVLPQEAWEGLQPAVRAKMHQQLSGSTVTMITAQCADGELKAEVA